MWKNVSAILQHSDTSPLHFAIKERLGSPRTTCSYPASLPAQSEVSVYLYSFSFLLESVHLQNSDIDVAVHKICLSMCFFLFVQLGFVAFWNIYPCSVRLSLLLFCIFCYGYRYHRQQCCRYIQPHVLIYLYLFLFFGLILS